MRKQSINRTQSSQQESNEDRNNLHGYSGYPGSEDIYRDYQSIANNAGSIDKINTMDDISTRGFDIPGSELYYEPENNMCADEERSNFILGEGDYIDLEEE